MFFYAQKDKTEIVRNNNIVDVGNVHAQATETLWLSTVHDSVISKTQQSILISHGQSSIYLDKDGIRINFGTDHVMTLNATGVHVHSKVQTDISQGDGDPNFVSCAANGVHVKGVATLIEAGNGASKIEMGSDGVIHTSPRIDLNP